MPTAGSILSNCRELFGDPNGDWFTDSKGLDWLNRAQTRFCHKVGPLDEFQGFVVVAKVKRYDVNADCITPTAVMWYQSQTKKLEYVTPEKMLRFEEDQPNASGNPDGYTYVKRQLVLGAKTPTQRSATALASGAGYASATAIALTAASGTFRNKGWLKNSTSGEILEYNTVSGATISGITRGVFNTASASIASADIFTQIDFVLHYRKAPSLMTATTQNPDIPAFYHEYLEKYVLYLAWLGRGDQPKADRAYAEFENYERDAIKTTGRRAQDGMMKIQEVRNRWRGW